MILPPQPQRAAGATTKGEMIMATAERQRLIPIAELSRRVFQRGEDWRCKALRSSEASESEQDAFIVEGHAIVAEMKRVLRLARRRKLAAGGVRS